MRQIFATALLTALALPFAATPAFAMPPMAGTYNVKGWNPGVVTNHAPSYSGTLRVVDMGGWYNVYWTSTAFKGESHGVGYLRSFGDKWVFSVGYAAGKEPAVIMYQVNEDAKVLAGDWVERGVGHEVATRH